MAEEDKDENVAKATKVAAKLELSIELQSQVDHFSSPNVKQPSYRKFQDQKPLELLSDNLREIITENPSLTKGKLKTKN